MFPVSLLFMSHVKSHDVCHITLNFSCHTGYVTIYITESCPSKTQPLCLFQSTKPVNLRQDTKLYFPRSTKPVTLRQDTQLYLPRSTKPVALRQDTQLYLPPSPEPVTLKQDTQLYLPRWIKPVTFKQDTPLYLRRSTIPVTLGQDIQLYLPCSTKPVTLRHDSLLHAVAWPLFDSCCVGGRGFDWNGTSYGLLIILGLNWLWQRGINCGFLGDTRPK